MGLEQPAELGREPLAIRSVADHGRQPHGSYAAHVECRQVSAVGVVEVGAAARHPGAEVRSDRPQDDDDTARHVLAAVLTETLDDRLRPGVADREAHPGATDEVQPAGGRAVQARVPSDRLAVRLGREVRLRLDDQPATRQALADVVVRLADESEIERRAGERAERLAGGAAQLELDRARQFASFERT